MPRFLSRSVNPAPFTLLCTHATFRLHCGGSRSHHDTTLVSPLVVPRRIKLVVVLDIPPARNLLVVNKDAAVLLLLAAEATPVLLEDKEQDAEHDHTAHRRGDGDRRRHHVGPAGRLLDAAVVVLVLLEAGCRGRRGVCRVARRGRAAQC